MPSNTRKVLQKPTFGSAPRSKSRSRSRSRSKSRSRRRRSAALKATAAAATAFKQYTADPFSNDPQRARAAAAAERAQAAAAAAFTEHNAQEAYDIRVGLKEPYAPKGVDRTYKGLSEKDVKKLFAGSSAARTKLRNLTEGAPAAREAAALAIQEEAYEKRMRALYAAEAAEKLYQEKKDALDATLFAAIGRATPPDEILQNVAGAKLEQWKGEEEKKMEKAMKGK